MQKVLDILTQNSSDNESQSEQKINIILEFQKLARIQKTPNKCKKTKQQKRQYKKQRKLAKKGNLQNGTYVLLPASDLFQNSVILKDYVSQQEVQNLKDCISGKNPLPNFIFVGQKCSKRGLAIKAMIKNDKKHRRALMQNFFKLTKKIYNEYQYQIEKMQKEMKEKHYQSMSSEEIFALYQEENFFYKMLNNMLRFSKDITVLFYVQPFVKDLFEAIKQQYRKNKDKETFILYRGATFSNDQVQFFQNNIDKYVEVLGFMSTSKNEKEALKFSTNVMLEILVQNVRRLPETDYGYYQISNKTKNNTYNNQKQILFNILNIFKISKTNLNKENGRMYIKLIYGKSSQLQYKLSQAQRMIKHYQSQEHKIRKSLQIMEKQDQQISYFQQQLQHINQDFNQFSIVLDKQSLDITQREMQQFIHNILYFYISKIKAPTIGTYYSNKNNWLVDLFKKMLKLQQNQENIFRFVDKLINKTQQRMKQMKSKLHQIYNQKGISKKKRKYHGRQAGHANQIVYHQFNCNFKKFRDMIDVGTIDDVQRNIWLIRCYQLLYGIILEIHIALDMGSICQKQLAKDYDKIKKYVAKYPELQETQQRLQQKLQQYKQKRMKSSQKEKQYKKQRSLLKKNRNINLHLPETFDLEFEHQNQLASEQERLSKQIIEKQKIEQQQREERQINSLNQDVENYMNQGLFEQIRLGGEWGGFDQDLKGSIGYLAGILISFAMFKANVQFAK